MPLYSTISTSSASISIIAGRLRPYPYTVWVGLCGALIFRLIGIAAVGSLAIVTVFDFFAEFCLGFLSAESSIQFNVKFNQFCLRLRVELPSLFRKVKGLDRCSPPEWFDICVGID